jgi:uncharacterized RDD family membrane protein YckC
VATQAGNVVLAGWGPRFAGYLLDGFLLYTPIVIVELIIGIGSALASLGSSSPSGLSAAAWAVICLINLAPIAYWFLFLRYRGQTLGMMVAGVRAIDRTTGHGLGTAQTWRRVLVFFCLVPLWGLVGFIVLAASQNGIGGGWVALFQVGAYAGALSTGLWPLRSPANQTLQDKAADTIVIRANSGSVPPVGSSQGERAAPI